MSNAPEPANRVLSDDAILEVVLGAMRTLNLARDAGAQLVVAPDAIVFGPGSPLDSLGLLNLLLDLEEDLQRAGCHVVLSDDRAMSQKRSPFRSVASLVEYVGQISRA
ncbi:MAG: hypothetical protein ABI665_16400 [Vicinamibacterales bacterium]